MSEHTPRSMLGITLWQPWALAVARLRKTIENRDWSTPYRGEIALHAGVKWDSGAVGFPPLVEAWEKFVADLPSDNCHHGPLRKESLWVEFGAVIAVVDLTRICSLNRLGHPCACGPWAIRGADHWQFDNVRLLPEPVKCRGYQKLWRLPPEVEDQVRAQL